jgi:hypothetical protein
VALCGHIPQQHLLMNRRIGHVLHMDLEDHKDLVVMLVQTLSQVCSWLVVQVIHIVLVLPCLVLVNRQNLYHLASPELAIHSFFHSAFQTLVSH